MGLSLPHKPTDGLNPPTRICWVAEAGRFDPSTFREGRRRMGRRGTQIRGLEGLGLFAGFVTL
jgi:hypothetical protein